MSSITAIDIDADSKKQLEVLPHEVQCQNHLQQPLSEIPLDPPAYESTENGVPCDQPPEYGEIAISPKDLQIYFGARAFGSVQPYNDTGISDAETIQRPVSVTTPHSSLRWSSSFKFQIITACLTMVFCWVLLGAVALVLAVLARKKWSKGDRSTSITMGKVSMLLISVGIISGVTAWSVLIWWLVANQENSTCNFHFDDTCYAYVDCVTNNVVDCGFYYSGCCYYN